MVPSVASQVVHLVLQQVLLKLSHSLQGLVALVHFVLTILAQPLYDLL